IEIEVDVEPGVDCIRRDGQEERITVRRRTQDLFGGNIASGARPVLDDEWLAKPVREPLTYQADEDVSCSAPRKPDDQTHRPRRIGLRPSDARDGRQRGRAGGQMMQKFAAGKFHDVSLNDATLHSGLMLAARITLPHFSTSSAMNLPKSEGIIGIGMPPKSSSRALIVGSARAALVSLLSLSMISAGGFLGATRPCHPLAS